MDRMAACHGNPHPMQVANHTHSSIKRGQYSMHKDMHSRWHSQQMPRTFPTKSEVPFPRFSLPEVEAQLHEIQSDASKKKFRLERYERPPDSRTAPYACTCVHGTCSPPCQSGQLARLCDGPALGAVVTRADHSAHNSINPYTRRCA